MCLVQCFLSTNFTCFLVWVQKYIWNAILRKKIIPITTFTLHHSPCQGSQKKASILFSAMVLSLPCVFAIGLSVLQVFIVPFSWSYLLKHYPIFYLAQTFLSNLPFCLNGQVFSCSPNCVPHFSEIGLCCVHSQNKIHALTSQAAQVKLLMCCSVYHWSLERIAHCPLSCSHLF